MSHSAGLIPFRVVNGNYEFFVGHPGGPCWEGVDYWALLKGRIEKGEDIKDTAVREFMEESGAKLDYAKIKQNMRFVDTVRQRSGKLVTAYAFKMEPTDDESINPSKCFSNMVYQCDWPEVDEYRWIVLDEIVKCTNKANIPFYNKIVEMDKNGEFGGEA